MARHILAIVAGVIAGGVFNMAIVSASHVVYPFPESVDTDDFEAIAAHVEEYGLPTGAFLMVLVAHAGGSLVSGLICGLLARRPWYAAALGMGLLWTCAGTAMLFLLPAPLWFAVADVLLYVPAALLGVRLGAAMVGGRSEPDVPGNA